MTHVVKPMVFTWAHALARAIDIYRLVPRFALAFYMWQMWHVADWGMSLKDLTTPQTVFVSTVYGVFPLLLNFYMQQGNAWAAPGTATQSQTPGGISVSATAGTPPPVTRGN